MGALSWNEDVTNRNDQVSLATHNFNFEYFLDTEAGHVGTIRCANIHEAVAKGSDERFLAAANTIEARVANHVWAVKAGTLEIKVKKADVLKRAAVYTQIIRKHRLMKYGTTKKENNAAFLKIMAARRGDYDLPREVRTYI